MNAKIVLIPGDGIGPEIVGEAKKVLEHVAVRFGHTFSFTEIDMGGCSIDKYGEPLTDENLEIAKNSDAILLGAVGGNTTTSPWYKLEPKLRPEAGLLKIRKALQLFANLRPAYLYPELASACPLRYGDRWTKEIDGVTTAVDTLIYSEPEIRRVAVKAFEIAMKRNKNLISVDKANVLDTSRLWRKVVAEVGRDYPEVKLTNMLVDSCSMQLVHDPSQFDVVVTENTFGDILSDEASEISGSMGMLSSASLNESKLGLYEPAHGSAPEIAGLNIANPLATILSAAMLLRYSLDLDKEADAIEEAVRRVLKDGVRTPDIWSEGCTKVGTKEMGQEIIRRI